MKPARARYGKISRLISTLVERYSIVEPPVPVDKIAIAEGAEIVFQRFNHEVSGLLLRKDGRKIIAVEKAQAPTRRRFTIAHELAHLLLHEGKEVRVDTSFRINLRSRASSTAEDVEEIEANAFAGALLMPEQLLAADLADVVVDIEDIRQIDRLAGRYEVSTQAMTYRLLNLHSMGRV